jgi:hypothetical protein
MLIRATLPKPPLPGEIGPLLSWNDVEFNKVKKRRYGRKSNFEGKRRKVEESRKDKRERL